MTTDRSPEPASASSDTSTPDSAYTSLSSLLKPTSSSGTKQGHQQKLLSPTPIRKSNANQLYTVSERSEAGSSRSSPNFAVRQGNQPEGRLSPGNDRGRSRSRSPGIGHQVGKKKGNPKKSVWSLIALTISMGGAQVAWVVELGYGTPYLLDLGLSEQLTSLVWLAGPISGLVAQPLIGAISDSSTSRYRRRYWIVMATVVLVFAGLALGFTVAIARALVTIFQGGAADWDPRREKLTKDIAIGIAVTAFYALDFALNALQASLRNLVLDVTPGEQLQAANAWHGRFNHVGNVVGFAMGSLKLANVPILNLVGGGQFRKVCIVAILVLVITVWITCWTQEEQEREAEFGAKRSKLTDVVSTIYEAVRHLPKPVRRVCYVQIAAFMGWFPYLFYSTTWVGEVMATELGHEPDTDEATRAGSLALLIYSCVAIVAGTILPYLAARDHRLLKPESEKNDGDSDDEDEEDRELVRIQEMVREWKAEAAREGRPLRLPTMPFMLRNIWTSSQLLFGCLMFTTFFINRVWQATVMIALVGICWAVSCWVPFAIIMEYLKEVDDRGKSGKDGNSPQRHAPPAYRPRSISPRRPGHARAASTPLGYTPHSNRAPPNERTGLIRSLSTADIEGINEPVDYAGTKPAGGTIMGIHNLAIVFPQFIIAIIASIIFKLADKGEAKGADPNGAAYSGVAWTLRFGGLCAVVGAIICRKVAPTKTEKAMRRRLADMQEQSMEAEA
ncbi:hypothetical protein NliqN6_3339 [Naganishia liquefaciens]|uniref:MFS transporter n=1 Tax=Naganishia liquefaciens TaxID=104408 RepID=A0A8H3YG71_9TREE|nr:hypothetical protein NliqN6_3339 [Naganishia liquefaciens]